MKRPKIHDRVRLIRDPRMVGEVMDRSMVNESVDVLWDDDSEETVMPEEIEPE